ncbi:hypothetical protein [Herminiimonas fonticola]|uniref:Uncharacterized protein n=1 Tax=Herminiimonas fonticola TaxID=303380 RepID=A0A4R6GG41_9BURK|nr:hypothetical protein [Herminiimonas fonticola]RBA24767.1 hypothetical protein Hfont_0400 [Herminiimonas fonticola]TDN93881.1 hypothetical protein EV677_0416 [Herminiimonas fonticola]
MEQDNLIERLTILEYAIRQSMTVREDQDEPANPEHKDEAERYGISLDSAVTKGDLLNAVQTLVRAKQKENIQHGT